MLDLERILTNLVRDVDGARFAAVAGMDGLLIERSDGATEPGLDVARLVAEGANLLACSRGVVAALHASESPNEIIVTSSGRTIYARMLDSDLFCAVVLDESGNIGKARLYSKRARDAILGELV